MQQGQKGIQTICLTNDLSGQPRVKMFSATNKLHTVHLSSYYPQGSLAVEKAIDEEGQEIFRFTDKTGKTILIRSSVEDGSFADTYYVYDFYQRLRFVLPPMAVDQMSGAEYSLMPDNPLDLYAYLYDYDGYGNLNYSKLPGCEPVYFLYDKANRCVLSQDGNLRKQGQWKATAYDGKGRVAYHAIVSDKRSQTQLMNITYGMTSAESYTGNSKGYGYTTELLDRIGSISFLIKANYYDDYRFLNQQEVPRKLAYMGHIGYGQRFVPARQLLTGEMTLELNNRTPYFTSHFYDSKAREVQTVRQNILKGIERHYYAYSFTGKMLKHLHEHSAEGKDPVTEVYTYTYDASERPLSMVHSVNGAAGEQLYNNVYDQLGRISQQFINGYKHAYEYNIRNWMTAIESPFFKENIEYQFYNGNISSLRWQTCDEKISRQYQFRYNIRNFISEASYAEDNGMASTANEHFRVSFPEYDKHGNMLTLVRQGMISAAPHFSRIVGGGGTTGSGGGTIGTDKYGIVDNLFMSYHGNQLERTSDQGKEIIYKDAMAFTDGADEKTEYTYDANGNMTADMNKGISLVEYNLLNLPVSISIGKTNKAQE